MHMNKTVLRRHISSFHQEMLTKIIPARKRRKVRKTTADGDSIRKCLVKLVTVHGRPLEIVNDSPMKKILVMAAGSNAKFCIRQLKKDIDIIADDVKKTIMNEIQGKSVSVLLDIVTKYCRSFLGVNIQYIINDKLVLRTIGMIAMHQSHTGAYIAQLVSQLANEYSLEGVQMYSMTTDNAKNVVKSIKDLNTTIDQLLCKTGQPRSFGESETNEEMMDEIMDDDDYEELSNILNGEATDEEFTTQHCSLDIGVDIESHPIDEIITELNKQTDSEDFIIEGLACEELGGHTAFDREVC